MQTVAAATAEYVPAGQSVQGSVPFDAFILPAGHAVHVTLLPEDASSLNPGLQTHADRDMLPSNEALPAGQLVQFPGVKSDQPSR